MGMGLVAIFLLVLGVVEVRQCPMVPESFIALVERGENKLELLTELIIKLLFLFFNSSRLPHSGLFLSLPPIVFALVAPH